MAGRKRSFLARRFEDGATSGVPRFDREIRKAIPGLRSVTHVPTDLAPDDVVIADNHMSMQIPEVVRTIVVHHGSAKTHADRDPSWRTPGNLSMVGLQKDMFLKKNRAWVAPSAWVKRQFIEHYKLSPDYAYVIPHSVPMFGPVVKRNRRRPVVIGDWRDSNKGAAIYKVLSEKFPCFEFRPLSFTTLDEKKKAYLDADLYLCLSASEGAPYSVADAEACELPIVTTNVGWCEEFEGATVFPFEERVNAEFVGELIRGALERGRTTSSFFAKWTEDHWLATWEAFVTAVERAPRAPIIKIPSLDAQPRQRRVEEVKPPAVEVKPAVRKATVGLSGGIGNAIFNLPLLKALKELGYNVTGYVETDYPSADLWRRCVYLDEVVEVPDPIPTSGILLSGPWAPRMIAASPRTLRYLYRGPLFDMPEWKVILQAAVDLGWSGDKPDVSDWCRDLDRTPKWDVGIVTGCKPSVLWERKKYPNMATVAKQLIDLGLKVCVLGTKRDPEVPGEDLRGTTSLEGLPDLLASCRVVLGTDSGVAQLAASLGVHTALIYTATSMVKGDTVGLNATKISKGVECSPCQSTERWNLCKNWICQDIPDWMVIDEVKALLEKVRSLEEV